LPFPQQGVAPAFAQLIHQIQDAKDKAKYKLLIANRLFAQKGYGYLPNFLKVEREAYGAPLEEVDFIQATEAARQAINSWVEKQTAQKIKDLFPQGVLNAESRLVLANAIYFKAAWMHPFDAKRTMADKFFVTADRAVAAPMMRESLRARYLKSDSFTALELPYESRQLSFIAFLPDKMDGLADLEKQLKGKSLQGWLAKLGERQVDVSLPKFKLTAEFRLDGVLKELGMRDAFSPAADFTGMTSRDKLMISAVVHKAFVDVNEAGTEAAAATGVAIGLASAPQPAVFRADHPFVYLIKDNKTGAILFMGRVVDPS
jgi:serpin B